MVSKASQKAVWDTYRPGQCDTKDPTPEWHKAADRAIKEVYAKEQQLCKT